MDKQLKLLSLTKELDGLKHEYSSLEHNYVEVKNEYSAKLELIRQLTAKLNEHSIHETVQTVQTTATIADEIASKAITYNQSDIQTPVNIHENQTDFKVQIDSKLQEIQQAHLEELNSLKAQHLDQLKQLEKALNFEQTERSHLENRIEELQSALTELNGVNIDYKEFRNTHEKGEFVFQSK